MIEGSYARTKKSVSEFFLLVRYNRWLVKDMCKSKMIHACQRFMRNFLLTAPWQSSKKNFLSSFRCNTGFGTKQLDPSSVASSLFKRAQMERVTVDLIRRSWVRFPPRSKDFFFASCGSLFPFTRANAQWVIYGFK